MNELASGVGYPDGQSPTAPFDRASNYLRSVAGEQESTYRSSATLPMIRKSLRSDPKALEITAVLEFEFTNTIPAKFTMRDYWKTGRFWFDYAAWKSFDVYQAALHEDGASVELLNDKARAEM
ncbi:hypothetical protein N7475_003304 [Penicillium sp. IBT 31633x]|nr:hypothetical protein N7475_003304 [Penicillium sp. IBT 31633x]